MAGQRYLRRDAPLKHRAACTRGANAGGGEAGAGAGKQQKPFAARAFAFCRKKCYFSLGLVLY